MPIFLDPSKGIITISNLEIQSRELLQYLDCINPDQWTEAIQRVIEVGVFCLQRAQTGQDTEFVKRQIDQLMSHVDHVITQIPQQLETGLIKQIGSDDSRVLLPIKNLVNQARDTSLERLNDVRTLLVSEIDPSKETSTLGKAIKDIKNLLDYRLDGSVPKTFEQALDQVTAVDGKLSSSVKTAVEGAVSPLIQEVDRLRTLFFEKLGEKEGQQAAADKTTLKGSVFEDEIEKILSDWSRVSGATISRVGVDNKAGDFCISFPKPVSPFYGMTLVVEAKNDSTSKGAKRIKEIMQGCMQQRSASSGILVSNTQEGLAQEVGDWYEGTIEEGSWIATRPDYLIVAIRYLLSLELLQKRMSSEDKLDTDSVSQKIGEIRLALKEVSALKKYLTEMGKASDGIRGGLDKMQRGIETALDAIDRQVSRPVSA